MQVAKRPCNYLEAAPCRRPTLIGAPQTGALLLDPPHTFDAAARRVSFGWNWPLAAPPGPGTARNQNLSTVGSLGLSSQPLATILGPFLTTFPNFGPCPLPDILTPLPFYFFSFSVTRQTAMPIRTAPRFCLGGCGRLMTPLPFNFFRFFSNSPNGNAH